MQVLLILLSIVSFILVGCGEQGSKSDKQVSAQAAANPEMGKTIFSARCKSCHGKGGTGSNQGPPLVHKIYEPGHHADYSFYKAVASGVRSHHWRFGNMPAIPGVSPENVGHIIAYIRQEQRLAGIK